jgi:ABC-2 type transport system permease protein
VDQVLVIPADFLTSGQLRVYDRDFQVIGEGSGGVAFNSQHHWMLRQLIGASLSADADLAAAITNPTPAALTRLRPLVPPEDQDAGAEAMGALVVQVMPYVFYFVLIIGSGYLLQSVTAEKENRTAEVLLVSISPRELMTGKVIGLGLVALLQLAVWLAGGIWAMNRAASALNAASFSLAPSLVVWAVVYVLLGFVLYGSIMAAGGAISPSAREAGQLTWVLVLPLLPTLMFSREFLENPDGIVSVALSVIPFSAPSAMVTRLAVAEVPWWQLAISILATLATAYLFILLAARFFRPENLLSSAAFSWRRFASAWRAR